MPTVAAPLITKFLNGHKSTALTINGVTNGNVVAGPTMIVDDAAVGTLSAKCVVDAETTSLTMAAVWEVCDDGSNWFRAVSENNASEVVLATGTAGADATVTKCVSAPLAVYGHRLARCSILVAGATGTVNDTATVSYDFRRAGF